MYGTIVIPLDGSPLAEQALPHGIAVAEAFGSRLVLIRAYDPLSHLGPGIAGIDGGFTAADLIEATAEEMAKEAELYLAEAADTVRGSGRPLETITVRGNIAESLAEVIEAQTSPLVVMTTRGRGGLKRFVLGSVTDALLHKLEVPVLVVPNRPG